MQGIELAEIVDLAHDGRGVARLDGKAVFVAGALPGEQVRIRRVKKRKRLDEAVLARENGIPFYVAAPSSTIDLKCPSGDDIPIEERDEDEMHYVSGRTAGKKLERVRVSPQGAAAGNPAFDVTPAKYITGIITERGIVKPGEIRKRFGK